MFKFLGASDALAFFSNGKKSVVIDTDLNMVKDYSQVEVFSLIDTLELSKHNVVVSSAVEDLAKAALSTTEASITAAGGDRMYTIPAGVQDEAQKALDWHKEHKRGGTPVGMNTARTLAKGGQIGIEKVRHIAKYFPRHEVDKKGKGWAPGDDKFPSNGRIAWALWGGDAAWRWARAIVERDNRSAVTATGYVMPGYQDDISTYGYENGYDADVNPFKTAHELDLSFGPEFMARVRLDNSGIDRLYKIDIDGAVSVWDDCGWDNLGHVDGDVYSYDAALDDPYDLIAKDHIIIDASSAVIISAFLQQRPMQPVLIEEIDPEESSLMAEGLMDEDIEMLDRVITAAGPAAPATPSAATDGNYTPDERSKNTQAQPRDASGLFVKVGGRTVVGGDTRRGSGTITDIDTATGKVRVRLDNGKVISVDPKFTQPESDFDGPSMVPSQDTLPPIDFSKILGEPRTPANSPVAHLPGTLPKLTSKDLHDLINGLPGYYQSSRNYKLMPDSGVTKSGQRFSGLKAYDKKYMKERYGVTVKASGFIAAAEQDTPISDPKKSDVAPKYLAIVSPDDLTAVMDVVALAPASTQSTETVAYTRTAGKWQRNDQILMDLKSATPPPVVSLDDQEILNTVLKETDQASPAIAASAYEFGLFWDKVVDPILAAGGLDRNRGNAEELRRYWTHGKGALKIRWGTPGDWTRCVRQLSKYMGPRAKGYCQLRHKEATGVYTGSKLNPGKNKKHFSTLFQSEEQFQNAIVNRAELSARATDARNKMGLVASASSSATGAAFKIPMLVPEGIESGDGRKFEENAITLRDLPLPLLWQIKTGAGHDGSVVVGRIDSIERIEGGLGNAYGVFDSGPYGKEAERLVRHGFLRGVSVDLDRFEAKEDKAPKTENAEDGDVMGKDKLTINKARIMAATIVAKPAFQECSIILQDNGDQEDNVTPKDGVYEESTLAFSDLEPMLASGFLDSDIPMTPPTEWFTNPKFTRATPLTVDSNGRVYGHIAAWNVNHIGLPRATKPPRSRSKYAYFHTGVLRTTDGTDVPVGQLTLAGGHAPLNADAVSAARHYDDTASAVADIHVGEDEYGIWCAGSLRPNLEEMQIRALRASAPSGDWRPINGSLELVAICQVNVPGFPTARAMIASGKVMALVAAGASYLAVMKSQAVHSLVSRADLLGQLATTAPNLKARAEEARRDLLVTQAADLQEQVLVAAAVAELAKISQDERDALAKEGKAMPDGAYPIRDVEDLKNAIQAYGRAKASERRAVRKHIIKQARKLKQEVLIPDTWKNAESMEATERLASMRASITAAATSEAVVAAAPKAQEISDSELKKLKDAKAEADKQTEEEIKAAEEVKANKGKAPDTQEIDPATGQPKYISGVNQPRDAKGKYRTVLARLKQNLGVAGLAAALKKAEEAENLDFAGDYEASAGASSKLLEMIDRLDTKALNPEALENVRLTAAELGKTIANLPLPFGEEAQKLKFSDLPAGLKDLIDSMITKVEQKIGKKDADIATQSLKSYMSGADVYSQSEVQSEMSKLLRLLT